MDALTARTRGSFNRFNVSLPRLQEIGAGWSVQGQLLAQWADRNLDSSEKFSLGGANGVRAYPQGEAAGDQGWLGASSCATT